MISPWSGRRALTPAVSLSRTTTLSRIICEVFGNRIETQIFARHVSCSGRRVACDDCEIAAGTAASTATQKARRVRRSIRLTNHFLLISRNMAYGLGRGVGRPLGVGTDLGVGVGLGVAVGVAVGVIAVGVGVQ